MSAKVMEALSELRLGVEMDAAHDPSGKTKLEALDEAMRVVEAADKARGGEVVAKEPVAWLRRNGFRFNADIEPDDDREIPLYTAPPAQAVDLEQFREAVVFARQYAGFGERQLRYDHLLALIDAQKEARNG